jgi:hypothetical protein
MLQNGCLVVGAQPPPCIAATLTSAVVGWSPFVWVLRCALVIIIVVATHVFVVALLRYFRVSVMRQMLNAPVPRLKGLGGKIAGVEANATFDEVEAEVVAEIARLNARVDELFEYVDLLRKLVSRLAEKRRRR